MSGFSEGVGGPLRVLDEDAALIQEPFNEHALLEHVRSSIIGASETK
jgi:hypothetical protein